MAQYESLEGKELSATRRSCNWLCDDYVPPLFQHLLRLKENLHGIRKGDSGIFVSMERKIIIGGCIAKGIPTLKQECPCYKASIDYLLNMLNKPPIPPSPEELPPPP